MLRIACILLTFTVASSVLAAPKTKNANEEFNRGLRLMKTIEAPLRAGKLKPEQMKTVQEVEAAYKSALELAPNHGRAHISLGMLYRFTNRFGEAIPHLERGMTLKEGSADWQIAAGTLTDVYFFQNKPQPAIPILEKLIKYKPKDAQVHYQLGIANYYAGKPEPAKKALNQALAIDPSHADAKKLLSAIN